MQGPAAWLAIPREFDIVAIVDIPIALLLTIWPTGLTGLNPAALSGDIFTELRPHGKLLAVPARGLGTFPAQLLYVGGAYPAA